MMKFVLVILLLLGFSPSFAQTKTVKKSGNSEGTEFWLCFQKNYRDNEIDRVSNQQRKTDPLGLELFITSNYNAAVKIEIEGINFKKEVSIRAGTVVNVKVDSAAQLKSSGKKERLAVHITSDNPVSVYGLNRRYQTTDTYMGLPVEVLGTEYRAMGFEKIYSDLVSQFAIVATEDETKVSIYPSSPLLINDAIQMAPYTIDMRKGDVYQAIAAYNLLNSSDVTGTIIKSNKKIAVFSGHNCAYVPSGVSACNHLVEQLPPLNSWGKHFYVGTLKSRSRSTIRILANEPNTKIFLNSQLRAILTAGGYYEDNNVNQNLQITADKPILVAQYAQGFRNGDSVGDPMMILVSPTQQFLNRYRFATPVNGSWRHYINVVVPRESIGSMRLNEQPISPKEFRQFGNSRFAIAQLEIPYGTHTIQGNREFGLYAYGFGFGQDAYDAYGNMGGQSFDEIRLEPDILPPTGEGIPLDGVMRVILRDDRENDRGMREAKVISTENIDIRIPQIIEGMPQVEFVVRPMAIDTYGKAILEATDAANNSSKFTICHAIDPETGKYGFFFSEGVNADCKPGTSWFLGGFASYSLVFHTADFGSSGNVKTTGLFSKESGSGGFGGVLAGIRLSPQVGFSARLSFDTYGGVLLAPDTVTSRVFTPRGYETFQEARTLDLNNIYTTLTVAGEYYFARNYYGFAGLKTSFALSKSVNFSRKILLPENYAYVNSQSKEQTIFDGAMDNLQTVRFGGTLGAGLSFPVWQRYFLFGEASYNTYFSDMISDGTWGLSHLTFSAGIKMRW